MLPFSRISRRIILGLILLFFVLAGSGAAVVTNVNTGMGYADIQSAIDAALPGHVIHVYPGTYNDDIEFIGKNNIQLLAWDFIINGINSSTTVNASSESFFIEDSSQITIQGFNMVCSGEIIEFSGNVSYIFILNNLMNNGNYGVRYNGSLQDYIYVISNEIRNSANRAVYMTSPAHYNEYLYNDISFTANDAIYLTDTDVDFNIFGNNRINNNGASGIRIQNGDNNYIYNNLFYNNGGSHSGIYFNSGTGNNNMIVSNHFSNNFVGIRFSGENYDNTLVMSNRIERNYSQDGQVRIADADQVLIYRNLIINGGNGSGGKGIDFSGSTLDNEIINNTIAYHFDDGIDFNDPATGWVYNNIFLFNLRAGVERAGGVRNITIDYNLCWGNGTWINTNLALWPTVGVNNITNADPSLNSDFRITLTNSAAWNVGTNIPVTAPWFNGIMDIGWKEYLVDLIPPWGYITNVVTDQVIGGPYIFRGTNDDDASGVQYSYLVISNDSGVVYSNAMSPAAPAFGHTVDLGLFTSGTYFAFLYTLDYAGLDFLSPSIRFQVPFQPPVIAVTNTPQLSYISGIHDFRGYATNVDSNPVLNPVVVYLQVDGGLISSNSIGDAWSAPYDTSVLSDGEHVFRFIAVHSQGQFNDFYQTNIVDNSPPLLVITDPSPGAIVSNTVVFTGSNLEPHSALSGFWYSTNGGSSWIAAALTNSLWSISVNTLVFNDGPLVFQVMSSNVVGLTAQASVTVTMVNYSGVFIAETNYINTTYYPYITGSGFSFRGYVSNSMTNYDPISVFYRAGSGTNILSGSAYGNGNEAWICPVDTTLYADGPVTFYFTGVNANNVSNTFSLPVTVDNSPPAAALDLDISGSSLYNQVPLALDSTDVHSGISYESVVLSNRTSSQVYTGFNLSMFDTSVYNNGDYSLIVTASNGVGLYGQRVYDFSIDNLIFNVLAGPNPLSIDNHDSVFIQGLTWDSSVRIYSVNGDLIRDFTDMRLLWSNAGTEAGVLEWDLENSKGNKVGSGVYLLLIHENINSGEEPIRLKLSVYKD